jgi:hypothetical protein
MIVTALGRGFAPQSALEERGDARRRSINEQKQSARSKSS